MEEGELKEDGRKGIKVGRTRRESKAGGSCSLRETERPSLAATGSCSSWRSARWSWCPGPEVG